MGNLVKEFYNIQNPALSAYLLSRFSLGYMEENQDMAPMPLLFIVLPMMYKKEIVDTLHKRNLDCVFSLINSLKKRIVIRT